MNYIKDAHVTIYHAGATDQQVRDAAIKFRNPSKGIHIEYIGRTKLGDHRIRVIAPDIKIFRKTEQAMSKYLSKKA